MTEMIHKEAHFNIVSFTKIQGFFGTPSLAPFTLLCHRIHLFFFKGLQHPKLSPLYTGMSLHTSLVFAASVKFVKAQSVPDVTEWIMYINQVQVSIYYHDDACIKTVCYLTNIMSYGFPQ